MMKVILMEELRGRGGEGDIIDVANGFAVNYLLPRKIAVEATAGNLKQLEQRKHKIEKREEDRLSGANSLQESLEGKKVTIEALVGEEGHLFGSITTQMIQNALAEQHGIEIDRKKLETHGAIKTAGDHEVTATIYRDVRAVFTVEVIAEGELVEESPTVEEIVAAVEAEEAAEEVAEAVAEEIVEEAVAEEVAEEIVEEVAAEIVADEAAQEAVEEMADESAETSEA